MARQVVWRLGKHRRRLARSSQDELAHLRRRTPCWVQVTPLQPTRSTFEALACVGARRRLDMGDRASSDAHRIEVLRRVGAAEVSTSSIPTADSSSSGGSYPVRGGAEAERSALDAKAASAASRSSADHLAQSGCAMAIDHREDSSASPERLPARPPAA